MIVLPKTSRLFNSCFDNFFNLADSGSDLLFPVLMLLVTFAVTDFFDMIGIMEQKGYGFDCF